MTVVLVLRSLKDVYKASAVGAWLGLGPSPDPGTGAGVELGGGHLGGVGNLIGVGEGLPGQRLAPEDPPPAFLQVQPAGAFGDEGMPDAGMVFQPGPGALAVVAGQIIGKAGELGSRRSCQALFSAWCRGFAGAGYGGGQAGDGSAAGGPAWGGLVPARQGGFDLAGADAGADDHEIP